MRIPTLVFVNLLDRFAVLHDSERVCKSPSNLTTSTWRYVAFVPSLLGVALVSLGVQASPSIVIVIVEQPRLH